MDHEKWLIDGNKETSSDLKKKCVLNEKCEKCDLSEFAGTFDLMRSGTNAINFWHLSLFVF